MDRDKDGDLYIISNNYYYISGMFTIAMKCMVGPSEGRGVKQLDDSYLKVLEDGIQNAPRAIVA